MKIKKYLLALLLLLPAYISLSQYSNCAHYSIKDGLPSSKVYSMAQDAKGFIWFGTEAGLVRYDGTNFKVFTTKDGLPDNDVLGLLFEPQTGRMWIVTFTNEPCYMFNDHFYTKKQDKELAYIEAKATEYIDACQGTDKAVYLYNANQFYYYENGHIKRIKMDQPRAFGGRNWGAKGFDILTAGGVETFSKSGIMTRSNLNYEYNASKHGKWIDNNFVLVNRGSLLFYSNPAVGIYLVKDSIVFGSQDMSAGSVIIRSHDRYIYNMFGKGVYSIDTALKGPVHTIWEGRVNDFFEDRAGNIWIATNDDGIIVFQKIDFKVYNKQAGIFNDNITALSMNDKNQLLVGNSEGEVYMIEDNTIRKINLSVCGKLERIKAITSLNDNMYMLANNCLLHYNETNDAAFRIPHMAGGEKAMLKLKNNKALLFGHVTGILYYHLNPGFPRKGLKYNCKLSTEPIDLLAADDLYSEKFIYTDQEKDTLVTEYSFEKRILTLAQHPDGRVFCGTMDGVYIFDTGKLTKVKDSAIEMHKRVSSLAFTPDSLLWIGTPSSGILVYNGKKMVGQITTDQYISYRGAICRKVIVGKPNEVWVVTNSGVNKIIYHYNDTLSVDNITPITTEDGLLSDDVNDLLVRDSFIYIATAKGLNIFNENGMMRPKPFPIYISSIRINGADSSIHEQEYRLSNTQNNVSISFIGISLLSGGYVRYQYRLLNTSSEWQTTTNTSVEFRSLSPNTYTFEVAVLDKFGNRSKGVARVRFTIRPAFYQTIWFWAAMFILALAIGFYLIRAQFRRQQVRYQKEQQLNTKIIELEQQALKAQMNPHFIFNCLASIQHFVNKEDGDSANRYLSNFAKLIRKTLDLSGEQYINLDKEVAYLENYIQMEKLRFQEKFDYKVEVDEDIDTYEVMIPPMLIQPIVENAIRHGLRYREQNDGMLILSFGKEGNNLICNVDDNGIGIKRSKELKTNMHVEYQSKGTKLTESRINAINLISDKKIKLTIQDKYDEKGNSTGTLAILIFEQ